MKEVKSENLKTFLDVNENVQTLDVREEDERQYGYIEGLHIPLSQLENRYTEVPKDIKVVVYCAGGLRSKKAIEFLENKSFSNLLNLSDGIYEYLKLV